MHAEVFRSCTQVLDQVVSREEAALWSFGSAVELYAGMKEVLPPLQLDWKHVYLGVLILVC